mmetsp:Transcript_8877/g.13307  ORF Transcript_8877/g.13307 Transcript_8877/m.13307 type:complete len:389 (+) Transcript_8877:71-1237(+)
MRYSSDIIDVVPVRNKGLGVISKRDIEISEIIVIDSPFLSTPTHDTDSSPLNMCIGCNQPISFRSSEDAVDEASDTRNNHFHNFFPKRTMTCAYNCGESYCSEECHISFSPSHKYLCTVATPSVALLRAHNMWRSSSRFRLFCLAAARVVAAYEQSVSLGNTIVEVIESYSHTVVMNGTQPANDSITHEFIRLSTDAVILLRRCLDVNGTLSNVDSMFDDHIISKIDSFVSTTGYMKFWCICASNAHGILHPSLLQLAFTEAVIQQKEICVLQNLLDTAPDGAASGAASGATCSALFPVLCRFNHSCNPNATIRVLLLNEKRQVPHSKLSAESKSNEMLLVASIALRPIKAGEEVCISYIDKGSESDTCHDLMERYGFQCDCVACCGR